MLTGWTVVKCLGFLRAAVDGWCCLLCRAWYNHNQVWWRLCLSLWGLWTIASFLAALGREQNYLFHFLYYGQLVFTSKPMGLYWIRSVGIVYSYTRMSWKRDKDQAGIKEFLLWLYLLWKLAALKEQIKKRLYSVNRQSLFVSVAALLIWHHFHFIIKVISNDEFLSHLTVWYRINFSST